MILRQSHGPSVGNLRLLNSLRLYDVDADVISAARATSPNPTTRRPPDPIPRTLLLEVQNERFDNLLPWEWLH